MAEPAIRAVRLLLSAGPRQPGLRHVLARDIRSPDGTIPVADGHIVPPSLIERLENQARLTLIREPITVADPQPRRT
jgi:hypothetical protein